MRKKKKIAIIGTSGVPSRYGGFETLAHNLVLNLNKKYDIHVYASSQIYPKAERTRKWNGAIVHYLPLSANGISSIIYDIISMIHALFYADRLIVLGVSGGIFIPVIKLFSKKRIIVNIDGLEWRRNKWSKWVRRFLRFSEKLAVRYSDAYVTDNEAIKRYTTIYYRTASHLVAYGANHVSKEKLSRSDYKKYPFLACPYAFKVARIEPENNIGMVLEAFAQLPAKNLVVVGNWQSSLYGAELKHKYEQYPNLFLLDPIYEQTELDKLRSNCFVYVHGHSAGGTNPSLVEAMYLELPILAFDVSYNRATTVNKAIFFKSVSDLVYKIETVPYAKLKHVGSEMRKIAEFRYTWQYISQRYASIIESFDYAYVKPKLRRKNTRMKYEKLLKNGYAHLEHSKLFYES